MNGEIGPNPAIYLLVNLRQFRTGERTRTGKVKTQSLWLYQGAALLYLWPNQVAQGFMEQMGRAVVAYGIFATLRDDAGLYLITDAQIAFVHQPIVNDETFEWTLCVFDMEDTNAASDIAMIANLPTALSIERGGVEQQQGTLRRTDALYRGTIHNQADHFTAASNPLIAGKFGGADALQQFRQGLVVLALDKDVGRAAALLLALHGLLKASHIDGETMFGSYLLRQFQWEAMGIIELKGRITRDGVLPLLLDLFQQVGEQDQTSVEGLVKLFLFQAQNFDDAVAL
jgi:hypothetical protein